MNSKKYKLAILNSHPIQYFAPLYKRISQEFDIDLTVYYCSNQGVENYFDKEFCHQFSWDCQLLEGYHAVFLKNFRKKKHVGNFWSLMNFEIVTQIYKEKFDAIWVHGYGYFTHLLTIVAAFLTKTPLFLRGESHLSLKRSAWKAKLHRILISKIYKISNGVLAIGSRNKELYLSYGVKEEKIFWVPYVVDNEFFIKKIHDAKSNNLLFRQSLGINSNSTIILFASKLIKRKNPDHLLKAFQLLQQTQTDTVLIFVGSGECEYELKNYVIKHHIKNVLFLGFQNQQELPKFYALADIFVLPSKNEPWGLVINEVMCSGVPIIASNEVGAVADLVKPGENGFLYPTGDVEKLSVLLKTLIDQPNLRKKMGKHSLEIINNWNFMHCINGIRKALQETVK
jgi:glycosyltransferase involved in cell wall biosynthesis